MPPPIAYENAIDLLDADHKMVKQLFIDFGALSEDGAPAQDRKVLADKICQEITVHAQIEEEIFYPEVRKALADDALLDEAEQEHAQASKLIAQIEGMKAGDKKLDETVLKLAKLVDEHVLQEREQVFLRAQYSDLDLRGLAVALAKRKQALKKKAAAPAKEAA